MNFIYNPYKKPSTKFCFQAASKIGTKASALKTVMHDDYDQLASFGKHEIDNEMISAAERFLINCICKDKNVKTFDELRNKIYHQKSRLLDLEKLPATASSMVLHIQRAKLQCYLCLRMLHLRRI